MPLKKNNNFDNFEKLFGDCPTAMEKYGTRIR